MRSFSRCRTVNCRYFDEPSNISLIPRPDTPDSSEATLFSPRSHTVVLLLCCVVLSLLVSSAGASPPSFDLVSPWDGDTGVYHRSRTLRWEALTGNRPEQVTVDHYEVYLNGEMVAKVPNGTTRYTTDSLPTGSYDWHVRAVSKEGKSYRSSSSYTFTMVTRNQFDEGIAVPAENVDNRENKQDLGWTVVNDEAAMGGKAISASPDTGVKYTDPAGFTKNSPRLDYRLNFREAGAYYLWIRGRGPKHGRSIHVGLNGEPVMTGTSIGRFQKEYRWSNLRDLSKHHPRALIHVPSKGKHTLNVWMGEDGFTMDELLLLPDSLDTISERAGFRDFSTDPGARNKTYEVVVYGGTPGGLSAAVTAARRGRSVLVIEDTRHLGGIYVNGINHQEDFGKDPLTELEKEFFGRRLGKYEAEGGPHNRLWAPHMAERAFVEMVNDEGISVRYGVRVKDVRKSGNEIERILLSDGSSVRGRIFIDASYFGDLMARAGVSYSVGREAKNTYGEPLAGIQKGIKRPVEGTLLNEDGELLDSIPGWADDYEEGSQSPKLMANNLRLTTTKVDANKVPFPEPAGYDPGDYELLLRDVKRNHPETLDEIIAVYHDFGVDGKSEFNNPNKARFGFSSLNSGVELVEADYETRDRMIRDEVNFALGMIYFLQNHPEVPSTLQRNANRWGLAADEYADHGHVPYEIYLREARRMKGRYVMTQQDLQGNIFKPDTVSMGYWNFDSHTVQRLAVDEDEYLLEGRFMVKIPRSYEIPYRSITPKRNECRNLLVPVELSCSRVAMTSLRLEPTWMPLGVAAGVAADLALESDKPVQGIPVSLLQQRLKPLGHNIDHFRDDDDTLPKPFDLISPGDGQAVTNSRPPFRWQASSDPETGIARYEVYVDGEFVKLVDGARTSYTPSAPLDPGKHNWHVVAFNGRGDPRRSSGPRTFRVSD